MFILFYIKSVFEMLKSVLLLKVYRYILLFIVINHDVFGRKY
jgi:type III secretory pathway component EscU